MRPLPPHLLSIQEAAASLGVKPADVDDLIDAGEVRTVTLIDPDSLPEASA